MALLLVELGSQTAQVLSIFGLLVVFTGLALAGSLLVVEALAVLLLPALDIPDFWSVAVVAIGVVVGGEVTNSF